jgi:predicted alpha/beta superfamily hydrolase
MGKFLNSSGREHLRGRFPSPIKPAPMDENHTLTGNIQEHRQFESRILRNQRDVLVYLPPGYRRTMRRRYPVLYLNDGQNVFDAATSYAGVEWGADESAQRLIGKRWMEPLIIVAVANAGEERIHEYAPSRGFIDSTSRRKRRSRGLLRKYGKFLSEELKQFIDRTYRTRPEAQYTGIGGSSLGGLAALSLGLWFPQIFTRLAVLSPSIWWDECVVCQMVGELEEKPPLKIWLDTGTREEGWERARELRDRLVEKGWRLDDDLQYTEVEGADHSEGAWAARFEAVLRFLYPPAPPGMKEPLPRPLVLATELR